MNEMRFCIAQFCDDVRQEIRNKVSLIGCYGDEVIFDNLPALVPRLCAYVRAVTPKSKPFARLVFRATLNGDLLGELEIPAEQLRVASSQSLEIQEIDRTTVVAVLTFSPLGVSEAGVLAIDAETEDGLLAGPRIRLRAATQSQQATTVQ